MSLGNGNKYNDIKSKTTQHSNNKKKRQTIQTKFGVKDKPPLKMILQNPVLYVFSLRLIIFRL